MDVNSRAVSDVDRKLGERLRYFRALNNVSQEKLAERVGLTFQQIQKYEKGINRISASRLFELAAVFNVGIADFFADIDQPETSGETNETAELLQSKDGAALTRLFVDATPERRRMMVRVARAVAQPLEAAE
jgi:transcriptional regulator with XRE-family HTH domain